VLLIGHLDTVFEPSHPFQRFSRQGPLAIGPGVNDMKGGLVIILSALNALHASGGLEGSTIAVVLTGDEEKAGSPLAVARRDLIQAGKQSDVALCFEGTARVNGADYITVSRRSSFGWTLRVSSVSGHSSQIFSKEMGPGAIYEIARILNEFETQLRDPLLTYSPGLIVGGTSAKLDESGENGVAAGKDNVVAREAAATGDIRAITPEQLARTEAKMKAIVARHAPTTKAEITFDEGYPPMAPTEGNRKLAAQLNEVNRALGFKEEPELDPLARGAGDISFVAADVDSLSGLGMSGENSHAAGESADLDRLPIYAKRAALFIYRLTSVAK
jgi:glutamate carboxypeptidase